MIDYRKRRDALMESIDVDAFAVIHLEGLAADQPSMTYLTGYSGFGVLLLTHEEVLALATTTNIDQARVDAPHLKWQVLDWNYAHWGSRGGSPEADNTYRGTGHRRLRSRG